MIQTKKPVNYLSNSILLEEIHKSKATYCSYTKPEYHDYHYIVEYQPTEPLEKSLEYLCRPETIQAAIAAYSESTGVPVEEVDKTKIVFRVMTWEHVPNSDIQYTHSVSTRKSWLKSKKKKQMAEQGLTEEEIEEKSSEEDFVKDDDLPAGKITMPFPPFQHFMFDNNGSLQCVGKSHWKNFKEGGEYSDTHGKITNNLGKAFLMLVERYSLKWNFRGYSYLEELRGNAVIHLCTTGLRFNENKSQNPFAFYTQVVHHAFVRVLNIEKQHQEIRDELLIESGYNASFSSREKSIND